MKFHSPILRASDNANAFDNLYTVDGVIDFGGPTERRITIQNNASVNFSAFNTLESDYTERGELTISSSGVTMSGGTGDGAGNDAERVIFGVNLNGIQVIDTRAAATGMSYLFDHSATQTAGDRWIPDKGYVDSAIAAAAGGADESTVASIAKGSTLGLEQSLLAKSGQVGLTVLAVAHTFHQGATQPSPDHKVQISSLGDGNVVFVYANGADFSAGSIQEGPIFLAKGEVYVIENVQNGSIITSTEGAYGYSQQRQDNSESPMPLLSLALAFTDTFCFAFRNSNANEGRIWCVNGPIANSVTLRDDNGDVVTGQLDIPLEPWEWLELNTDGNGEYRVMAAENLMSAIAANMDANGFHDSRLVLPLSNSVMTWARSGFISALYSSTFFQWFVNDGAEGTNTVSPGGPLDFDGITGADDADYEPRGLVWLMASGLLSCYSGADTSGLEATPGCPSQFFTQRLALPLHIRNSGDGGNNGIALGSKYTGTARLYQWNPVSGQSEIVTLTGPDGVPTTEIQLVRRNGATVLGPATTADEQKHPASALISAAGGVGGGDPGAYDMQSDFTGGYIEIDVPAMCVFNSEQNQNGATTITFRGTSGANVVGIHSDDDEQLTFGITPDDIRAEITRGVDGIEYKRQINAGVETWVAA